MKFLLPVIFIGIVCVFGYYHHRTHAEFETVRESLPNSGKQLRKMRSEIDSIAGKAKAANLELSRLTHELTEKKYEQAALIRDSQLTGNVAAIEEKSQELVKSREQLLRFQEQKRTVQSSLIDAEVTHNELESDAESRIKEYDKKTDQTIRRWKAEADKLSGNSLQRQKALKEYNEKAANLNISVFRAKQKLKEDVDNSKAKLAILSRGYRSKIAAIDAKIDRLQATGFNRQPKEAKPKEAAELLPNKIANARQKLDVEYEPKLAAVREEIRSLSSAKSNLENELASITLDSSKKLQAATEVRDQKMSRATLGCGIALAFLGIMAFRSFSNEKKKD